MGSFAVLAVLVDALEGRFDSEWRSFTECWCDYNFCKWLFRIVVDASAPESTACFTVAFYFWPLTVFEKFGWVALEYGP